MWGSLTCTHVSAPRAAAIGGSPRVAPSARGTPPATVHTTAAPVHEARQLNACRRAGLWPGSVASYVFIWSSCRVGGIAYVSIPEEPEPYSRSELGNNEKCSAVWLCMQ